ncbi:hypothetical protein VNO77_22118 [Canavalia gladiata]|uniref:Uncharacterized protein n=1 Tax=Canavalia gladiata TaxID=3824 RepID=A0AAN9QAR3_CANGL
MARGLPAVAFVFAFCVVSSLTANPSHFFVSLQSFRVLRKVDIEAMVLDTILSSPRLKSPSFRRQFTKDELGSWSTLVQRHRFLLSALVLLTLLCTVYLYFAVTLGAGATCSGLTGAQKASCHMELVKDSMANGKLKFL